MEKHNICSIDDRAAQKAKTLWLKTKTEFTGNWHIDLDDQAIIVNAVAAALQQAYAEIKKLKAVFNSLALDRQGYEGLLATGQTLIDQDEEIARLRAELASIEQFAESWPCHCAENYPGATMYHGQDCQTAIAVEFIAQWRAAKVKP